MICYFKKIFFFSFLTIPLSFIIKFPVPKRVFHSSLQSIEKKSKLKIDFSKIYVNLRGLHLNHLEVSVKDKKLLSVENFILKYSYRSLFLGYPVGGSVVLKKFHFFILGDDERFGLKSVFSQKAVFNFKGYLQKGSFYGLGTSKIEGVKLFMVSKIMDIVSSVLNLSSDDENIFIDDLSFHFDKELNRINFSNILSSQEDSFKILGTAMCDYISGIYSIFLLKNNFEKEDVSKMVFSIYGVPSNLKFKRLND